MEPILPISVLSVKYCMQRVENCCKYCGLNVVYCHPHEDINKEDEKESGVQSYTCEEHHQLFHYQQHHHQQQRDHHKQQSDHQQHEQHQQQLQQQHRQPQQQLHLEKEISENEQCLPQQNTKFEKIIWRPWENRDFNQVFNSKRNNKNNNNSNNNNNNNNNTNTNPITLVCAPKTYNYLLRNYDTILQQFGVSVNIELVADKCAEDEKYDEENDLIDDLFDALKLHQNHITEDV